MLKYKRFILNFAVSCHFFSSGGKCAEKSGSNIMKKSRNLPEFLSDRI